MYGVTFEMENEHIAELIIRQCNEKVSDKKEQKLATGPLIGKLHGR